MNRKKNNYWVNASIALVIGLVVSSIILGWSFVKANKDYEAIRVIGPAPEHIKSDLDISRTGIPYQGIKLADTYNPLLESSTRVEQYLIAKGFPGNQNQFPSVSTISLQKLDANGTEASKITGYSSSQEKVSGQSGRDKKSQIHEAETLLSNLGYWITKVDGLADSSTKHAIIAFQKVEGRKRTGVLTEDELQAMRLASRPTPKCTGMAYIEVDIARQVLFLVDNNGIVTHILPVSTGSGKTYLDRGKRQIAETPRGNFQITRQINGIRHAPLGALYYPNYFDGGVAIHGSNSVPVYPASHGCVRIPNFAAKEFLNHAKVEMPLMIYD